MRQRDVCVDSHAFDSRARSLSSRRRALTAIFGGTLVVLALTDAGEVNADSPDGLSRLRDRNNRLSARQREQRRRARDQRRKEDERHIEQEKVIREKRYTRCMTRLPVDICEQHHGCTRSEASEFCIDCYADTEACCFRAKAFDDHAACGCMIQLEQRPAWYDSCRW